MITTTDLLETQPLRAHLESGQQRAAHLHQPVVVSIAILLPSTPDLVSCYAAAPSGSYRVYWARPSQSRWTVGVGEALRIVGRGEQRYQRMKQAHRRLMESALIHAPDVTGVGPAFFGGFRFDIHTERSELWRGFDDGMLVLPKFIFARTPEGCWLTLNMLVQPTSDVNVLERDTREELALYERPPSPRPDCWQQVKACLDADYKAQWDYAVTQVLQSIEKHQLEKVVLARQLLLRADAPLSPEAVLGRLEGMNSDCLVFALGADNSCFLGATPELLVRLDQGQVLSICLAGTTSRSQEPAQDEVLGTQLLSSPKNRKEHALVVQQVVQDLEPLSSGLQWNEVPDLLKLPGLQHLRTSFTGQTEKERHVLDFVERLHPTPAMAGAPKTQAMKSIRELERMDRGWYSGPIGWLDRHGDGEFGIAIRSALLRGNTAVLHAGAGIVAGSNKDKELVETELKFDTMRSVLGGAPQDEL